MSDLRVGDTPVKEHIVDKYEASRSHQLQHELEVVPILTLVCICSTQVTYLQLVATSDLSRRAGSWEACESRQDTPMNAKSKVTACPGSMALKSSCAMPSWASTYSRPSKLQPALGTSRLGSSHP